MTNLDIEYRKSQATPEVPETLGKHLSEESLILTGVTCQKFDGFWNFTVETRNPDGEYGFIVADWLTSDAVLRPPVDFISRVEAVAPKWFAAHPVPLPSQLVEMEPWLEQELAMRPKRPKPVPVEPLEISGLNREDFGEALSDGVVVLSLGKNPLARDWGVVTLGVECVEPDNNTHQEVLTVDILS